MINYKKSLENQTVRVTDVLEPRPEPPKMELFDMIGYAIVLSVVILAALLFGTTCHRPQPAATKANCVSCHNRQNQLADYFKSKGSSKPEEMAYAVLKTKNSKLLTSIAVVESGGNPDVRHTGYKKRHHGAFQVNPRHWGTVPKDALGQALQAERILIDLTDKKPIKAALNYYGGDSGDGYSKRILRELVSVP